MRLITIGTANVNTTVGALHTNAEKVRAAADTLNRQGVSLACFGEQTISGYPAEDLVLWASFVEGQWTELERLARDTKERWSGMVLVVGVTVIESGMRYNCAAVLYNGAIVGLVPKEKLPTYDVFYEARTFSPGQPGVVRELHGVPFGDLVFAFPSFTLGVEVCEDAWSQDGPMRRRTLSGAEVVVNLSASPFRSGVYATRKELLATRSADCQTALVYVNQVGGNDALVFDGGGFLFQNGRLVQELPRWVEATSVAVLDIDGTARRRAENSTWRLDRDRFAAADGPKPRVLRIAHDPQRPEATAEEAVSFLPSAGVPRDARTLALEEFEQALELGIADYFLKTKAFDRIGVALSGGKDSALVLILAARVAKRLGRHPKEFVHAFSMPSRFNSTATKDAARQLAHELGVAFLELPIEDAIKAETEAANAMFGTTIPPIAHQNLQARIRASRMWNWSNAARGMWLQAGNMTEKAYGYTTIGGDLQGSYAPLGNVPKTVVIELLAHLGKKYGLSSVPAIVHEPASAELADDQQDENDLGPFAVADTILALFAGEKKSPRDIMRALPERKELVKKNVRRFLWAIFKWVQAPEATHVGTLDLDRERALQLPAVQSHEWLGLEEPDEPKKL